MDSPVFILDLIDYGLFNLSLKLTKIPRLKANLTEKKMTVRNDLINIAKHNKDGSFGTRSKREKSLQSMFKELKEVGYKLPSINNFKTKHVNALVDKWKADGLTSGTMKNKLSHVRWLSEKIGKQNIVARENSEYGIENRVYVTNLSKGKELDQEKLNNVTNEYVKASLILQREFGLRREEAIKFQHNYAVRDNAIVLKASWCKGGKERTVPIDTPEQRQALEYVKQISPYTGCLIPAHKNYIGQLKTYEHETSRVKLNKMHGLRHQYAQDQFKRISGYDCPVRGGKSRKDMSHSERQIDNKHRIELSKVLGHERMQITAVYIGS